MLQTYINSHLTNLWAFSNREKEKNIILANVKPSQPQNLSHFEGVFLKLGQNLIVEENKNKQNKERVTRKINNCLKCNGGF